MELLNRTSKNCATWLAWFEVLFLVGLISIPLTVFVSGELIWFQLAVLVPFIFVTGLLAYQIGYQPLVAVLWSVALFIPIGSLVVIVVLFIQAIGYLKKSDYKISGLGAKPMSTGTPAA
jgi:hypothetical protein